MREHRYRFELAPPVVAIILTITCFLVADAWFFDGVGHQWILRFIETLWGNKPAVGPAQ